MPGGNPNHDPKTGEFTSGDGGGGAGGKYQGNPAAEGARAVHATYEGNPNIPNPNRLGSAAHAAGKSTGDHTSDKAVYRSKLAFRNRPSVMAKKAKMAP